MFSGVVHFSLQFLMHYYITSDSYGLDATPCSFTLNEKEASSTIVRRT